MKEAKPFVSDPKVMSMHNELSVKSRVRGDFHARFCERVRVKLPRSTRPMPLLFMECIDHVQGQFYDEGNLTCGHARAQ